MHVNLKNSCGIYRIVNTANNKCYIGSTSRNFYDRFCAHRSVLKRNKHSSIHLQNAYNLYGIQIFKFEVLEICAIEDIPEKEKHYIKLYNSSASTNGYNISQETNNSRLGHTQSLKTRCKISKTLSGLKRSKTVCERISRSKTGHNNPMYGVKQTTETKEKRAKALRLPIIRSDGRVYDSLSSAAKDLNTTYQNVSQALRKGYRCCGYKFTYIKRNKNGS